MGFLMANAHIEIAVGPLGNTMQFISSKLDAQKMAEIALNEPFF